MKKGEQRLKNLKVYRSVSIKKYPEKDLLLKGNIEKEKNKIDFET